MSEIQLITITAKQDAKTRTAGNIVPDFTLLVPITSIAMVRVSNEREVEVVFGANMRYPDNYHRGTFHFYAKKSHFKILE